MTTTGDRLFLCSCAGSMTLDAEGIARHCGKQASTHNQLCRAELAALSGLTAEDGTVTICCTQETPIFDEAVAEGADGPALNCVNIRETAGWSAEGAHATPKIAALIAATAVEGRPARTLTVRSEGRTLIYGPAEQVLAAADQIAPRLDVTAVIAPPGEAVPPAVTRYPVLAGRLNALSGSLGGYVARFKSLAAAEPSSRSMLAFATPQQNAAVECDLVIELSGGTPLLSGDELRDGYFRCDPGNPAAVQKALFDAVDLVGEFEKPIYVAFEDSLCAHSRSAVTGCTRCLDLCPASAIAPAGDHVAIDAAVCAGCGSCASVCPTGAATYDMPSTETLLLRLRSLLRTYRNAGGTNPVLLFHDVREGDELIRMMSRFARGLPARVLPVQVNEVTQLGFEALATAFAFGAERVLVLAGRHNATRGEGLAQQVQYTETVMAGLGYGTGRIELLDERDPERVCDLLYAFEPMPIGDMSGFLPSGGRRSLITMALNQLHRNAPSPVDHVAMPDGAPFGTVEIDVAGCTLCLACVGACPTGALADNPDAPMLRFTEQACIQCGLCRNTCPEKVMSLTPRINFTPSANSAILLKEEEPFQCISCGKPFGARSSIERTIERLANHSMFADDTAALDRLKMCEECRVFAQFSDSQPMAHGTVPRPRTTDDYREGREDGEDEDRD